MQSRATPTAGGSTPSRAPSFRAKGKHIAVYDAISSHASVAPWMIATSMRPRSPVDYRIRASFHAAANVDDAKASSVRMATPQRNTASSASSQDGLNSSVNRAEAALSPRPLPRTASSLLSPSTPSRITATGAPAAEGDNLRSPAVKTGQFGNADARAARSTVRPPRLPSGSSAAAAAVTGTSTPSRTSSRTGVPSRNSSASPARDALIPRTSAAEIDPPHAARPQLPSRYPAVDDAAADVDEDDEEDGWDPDDDAPASSSAPFRAVRIRPSTIARHDRARMDAAVAEELSSARDAGHAEAVMPRSQPRAAAILSPAPRKMGSAAIPSTLRSPADNASVLAIPDTATMPAAAARFVPAQTLEPVTPDGGAADSSDIYNDFTSDVGAGTTLGSGHISTLLQSVNSAMDFRASPGGGSVVYGVASEVVNPSGTASVVGKPGAAAGRYQPFSYAKSPQRPPLTPVAEKRHPVSVPAATALGISSPALSHTQVEVEDDSGTSDNEHAEASDRRLAAASAGLAAAVAGSTLTSTASSSTLSTAVDAQREAQRLSRYAADVAAGIKRYGYADGTENSDQAPAQGNTPALSSAEGLRSPPRSAPTAPGIGVPADPPGSALRYRSSSKRSVLSPAAKAHEAAVFADITNTASGAAAVAAPAALVKAKSARAINAAAATGTENMLSPTNSVHAVTGSHDGSSVVSSSTLNSARTEASTAISSATTSSQSATAAAEEGVEEPYTKVLGADGYNSARTSWATADSAEQRDRGEFHVSSSDGVVDSAAAAAAVAMPLPEPLFNLQLKRERSPYRPSTALNEDDYDFAIVVRAVVTTKQEQALARAKAQADALAAAHAQQSRLYGGVNLREEAASPAVMRTRSAAANRQRALSPGPGSAVKSHTPASAQKPAVRHSNGADSASESDSNSGSDSEDQAEGTEDEAWYDEWDAEDSGDEEGDRAVRSGTDSTGSGKRKRRQRNRSNKRRGAKRNRASEMFAGLVNIAGRGISAVRQSLGGDALPAAGNASTASANNASKAADKRRVTFGKVSASGGSGAEETVVTVLPRSPADRGMGTAGSFTGLDLDGADDDEDDQDFAKVHKCAEILAALRKAGLQAKRVRSLSRRTWLIKIRCPEWRLEIEAEKLRLRMRRRDGGWSKFKRSMRAAFVPAVQDDAEGDVESRGGSARASLFHSSDRQTLIDHILRSSTREGGAELGEGSPLGAYVTHMFPLHMHVRLQELRSDWLAIWRASRSRAEHDRVGLVDPTWYAEPRLLDVTPAMTSGMLSSLCGKKSTSAQSAVPVASQDSGSGSGMTGASKQDSGNKAGSGDDEPPAPGILRSACVSCCNSTFVRWLCALWCVRFFYTLGVLACKTGRSITRCGGGLLTQPLDRIASYFGETIAFYFAWLEFYTQWLVVPSVVGVLLFVGQLWYGEVDIPYVPLFSLFMAVWSIAFLEYWKRRNTELAQRWGVLHYEDEEAVRPQFAGKWKQDAATGEITRVYPTWRRVLSYSLTLPIVLACSGGIVVIMLFLYSARDHLLAQFEEHEMLSATRAAILNNATLAAQVAAGSLQLPADKSVDVISSIMSAWEGGIWGFLRGDARIAALNSAQQAAVLRGQAGLDIGHVAGGSVSSSSPSLAQEFSLESLKLDLARFEAYFAAKGDWKWWIAMTLPPVLVGVLMPLIDWAFGRIAIKFNDWENHVTESQYRNHRIAKVFFFRFTCSFISLFYYAFSPQHSLTQLSVQLAAFLVVGQVWGTILEAVLPACVRKVRECKFRRRVRHAEESGLTEGRRGRRLVRHAKAQAWIESRMPQYDSFNDYAELLIQFGYVTFFSWAFPLAPLCALVNNVMEMRSDAYKLCYNTQRPIAHKSGGIGVWYNVLVTMSLLAVLTNCAHLALVSKQFSLYFPNLSDSEKMLVVFVFEHLVLSLRLLLPVMIDPVPGKVQRRMQRDNFALARLQGRRSLGQ